MLPSIFGEDLFDDFFGDPFEMMVPQSRNPLYGKHAKNLMKTDVRETEDSYEPLVMGMVFLRVLFLSHCLEVC